MGSAHVLEPSRALADAREMRTRVSLLFRTPKPRGWKAPHARVATPAFERDSLCAC